MLNCTIDNCPKPGTHTFVWPWGTEGCCCQDHIVIVQQKARAARGRFGQVSFTRLDPDRPVELRRDERIELHSSRLTAEAERDDARLRAAQLFKVNTELSAEVRALRARGLQLEADGKALREQIALAVVERDKALVSADHARQEAERLGVVVTEQRSEATELAKVNAEVLREVVSPAGEVVTRPEGLDRHGGSAVGSSTVTRRIRSHGAESLDGGETWHNSKGEKVEDPRK